MRGFSTLELTIAIGVLVSTLAGVVLVSGGAWHSTGAGEGLTSARIHLEERFAERLLDARDDLNTLTATSTSDANMAYVENAQQVPNELGMAALTMSASRADAFGTHVYEATRYVARYGVETEDECIAGFSQWDTATAHSYALLAGVLLPAQVPLGHSFSATYPINALDARAGVLLLGVASTSAKGNDTLFIFDGIHEANMPHYVASIDTNTASTDGISAVVLAHGYAFVGNAHDANFKTCKVGPSCAQLQIVDLSNIANPKVVVNFLLATSSAPGVLGNMTSSGQAIVRVLMYQNGYLYVGLSKTASGPEFNILDVHDPLAPRWVGGYAIGASINGITLHNGIAYVATDDKTRELIELDVHTPSAPAIVQSFDPKGTAGYEVGERAAFFRNTLFFGMSYANGSPELYVLDPDTWGIRVATTTGATNLGLHALGSQLFFITTTTRMFQVRDIQTLALQIVRPLPGMGAALVCTSDIFIAASNVGGQGSISLITHS